MAKRLTAFAVENLRPGPKRQEIPDPGMPGLYVVLQPSGRKGFAVRFRFAGIPRKLTLQPGISLAAARAAAANALFEVEQGRDPTAAKRAIKAPLRKDTLLTVWETYRQREGVKLRTIDQRCRTFERLILPVLGDRPISAIRRLDIVQLLDGIEDNSGPRMAHEVLAYLSRLFNWHAIRDNEFCSPIVRGMGRVNAKERARSRILSDHELKAVWIAAETSGVFGAFVRFLLLTAARRDEAAELIWSEVEGDDWILPPERSKTKAAVARPLSGAVRALLGDMGQVEGCRYVFTSNGVSPIGGFSGWKVKLDKASRVDGWVLHDLRRTARSLMSRAAIQSDVAEMCLGHTLRGVRGIYDRHSYRFEKLQAFEALAELIERIVRG
jgi:integrase